MRNIHILLLIITPSLFVFALPTFAQTARENRSVRVVSVPKGEVVNETFFVKAGEVVEISGVVNGDVYIAGGQILVDGVVNGDLLVGGGTITVSGEVSQDLIVAAGQINISGKIGRNLTAVGGNIEINESAKLGGGVVAAGGNVFILTDVPGDVKIVSGNLTLASKVDGDIEAVTGSLRVTSNAQISKDLIYTSNQEAQIGKGASISGMLLRKTPPVSFGPEKIPSFQKISRQIKIQATILSFFSALIVGFLMIKFFPIHMEFAKIISKYPWKTLGVGFLTLIGTPIAVMLLLITLLGLPLGIIFLFSYLICLYLAKIYVSYWIGRQLYKGDVKKAKYMPYLLGLLIYYILRLVPYVGGFIAFVSLLLGLGVIILGVKDYYLKVSKAKLI